MPVGLQEFNVYLSAFISICTVEIILPPLHLYILIRRTQTWSKFLLLSELFYAFNWALCVLVTIHYSLYLYDERQIRLHAQLELEATLEFYTENSLKWELAMSIVQVCQLYCMKMAFLFMYWNIAFRGYHVHRPRKLRLLLYATAISLVVTFIVIMIVDLKYCWPLSRNWSVSQAVRQEFCSPTLAYMPQTIWVSLTIITDLMIISIPLFIISTIRSNMSRIERRVLPLLFFIGALSIAAAIIRYTLNTTDSLYPKNSHQSTPLTLQKWHQVVLLSTSEIVAALVAFAMPAFRVVLVKAFWGSRKREILKTVMTTIRRRKQISRDPDLELMETNATTLVEQSADMGTKRSIEDKK